ncbi:MAG: zinc ribbon domain-containing protein [Ktedonobacterales bacterium]|nr:zinc ribbon domain-containing protein [Ktedonobacterales bacterium]
MICGLPGDASANTQPNGGDVIPVVYMVRPEPTPAPIARQSRPLRTADPAATNPGSGVFCGRCGSAVDPHSEFCGICGYPLREDAIMRLHGTRGFPAGDPLAEADAADTLPPLGMPRASNELTRLIGVVLVGILVVGIAFGVLILHLR